MASCIDSDDDVQIQMVVRMMILVNLFFVSMMMLIKLVVVRIMMLVAMEQEL